MVLATETKTEIQHGSHQNPEVSICISEGGTVVPYVVWIYDKELT